MRKGNIVSFMKDVSEEQKRSGNLGTAYVYRGNLNTEKTFT